MKRVFNGGGQTMGHNGFSNVTEGPMSGGNRSVLVSHHIYDGLLQRKSVSLKPYGV